MKRPSPARSTLYLAPPPAARGGRRAAAAWAAATAVLAGGSYLLARWVGLGPSQGPWAYWPIAGILLGIFHRRPKREWPLVGLAAAVGQVLTIYLARGDLAGGSTVVGALATVLQGAAGAAVLRRLESGEGPLASPRDLAVFVIVAVCLIPLAVTPVTGVAFAGGLHLGFFESWSPLFVGNSLSMLLFAPPLLQPWQPAERGDLVSPVGKGEVALCQAALLVTALLTFGARDGWLQFVVLPYALFPVLAWSALRCGPRWTAVSIVAVATVSAWFTARGTGPFAAGADARGVLHLQAYLAFAGFTSLVLSAITEQARRTFRELWLRTAIQEAFFDSSTALMVLKDLDGRYLMANAAAEAMRERTAEPILGSPAEAAFTPASAEMVEGHDRRVLERGEPLTFEETLVVHGEPRHFVATRFPVRDHRGAIRYLGMVGREETAERELAERLRRAQRVEMLGQLAAGLAHDLNNLLLVVSGNAELLRGAPGLDGADRAALDDVGTAAARASRLTQRLLRLGRTAEGTRTMVEVDEVLRGMEPILRALARGSVDVATVLAAPGARVLADSIEIDQIVLNLVSNARDAIADEGRITVETAVVADEAPAARGAGQRLRLRVADTGKGMDEATLARLFEPFFTTKAETGTGLGLYTTAQVVRRLGGEIRATSHPGAGTTFTIELPIAPAPEGADDDPRPAACYTDSAG